MNKPSNVSAATLWIHDKDGSVIHLRDLLMDVLAPSGGDSVDELFIVKSAFQSDLNAGGDKNVTFSTPEESNTIVGASQLSQFTTILPTGKYIAQATFYFRALADNLNIEMFFSPSGTATTLSAFNAALGTTQAGVQDKKSIFLQDVITVTDAETQLNVVGRKINATGQLNKQGYGNMIIRKIKE